MKGGLALSDMQLRLVERAAAHLPPERREGFLQDLAARLGEMPTTLAVESAIGTALEQTAVFMCDEGGT